MFTDTSQPPIDADAQEFRKSTFPRVKMLITERLDVFRQLIQAGHDEALHAFLSETDEEINMACVNAPDNSDIFSGPETAIIDRIADREIIFWKKPADADATHNAVLGEISALVVDGSMNVERAAKGLYFLDVLTHRYKNANGRGARTMKMLMEKSAGTDDVSDDEIGSALGIDKGVIEQVGYNTFRWTKFTDTNRLKLGVGYFGLAKGLSYEEVTEQLELQNKLPEESMSILADRLGMSPDDVKNEYIHFMTVESDLSWCDFE